MTLYRNRFPSIDVLEELESLAQLPERTSLGPTDGPPIRSPQISWDVASSSGHQRVLSTLSNSLAVPVASGHQNLMTSAESAVKEDALVARPRNLLKSTESGKLSTGDGQVFPETDQVQGPREISELEEAEFQFRKSRETEVRSPTLLAPRMQDEEQDLLIQQPESTAMFEAQPELQALLAVPLDNVTSDSRVTTRRSSWQEYEPIQPQLPLPQPGAQETPRLQSYLPKLAKPPQTRLRTDRRGGIVPMYHLDVEHPRSHSSVWPVEEPERAKPLRWSNLRHRWHELMPQPSALRGGIKQLFAAFVGALMVLSFLKIRSTPAASLDYAKLSELWLPELQGSGPEEQGGAASNETSCWSRRFDRNYYSPLQHQPAHKLLAALHSYRAMHKTCVAEVHDWTQHFHKLEAGREHCKYLIFKDPQGGVGMRLMSLLSAFLYSLLTERALLVDPGPGGSQSGTSSQSLARLLCDPFSPTSSWWTPPSFPSTLSKAPHQGEYVNGSTSNWSHKATGRRDIVAVYLLVAGAARVQDDHWVGDQQFFCDSMQKALAPTTWMSFESNQYIVPGLFLLDMFEVQLKDLFPNRVVLGPLARYLLHPGNAVWDRIMRSYHAYMASSSILIGLQIRTDNDEYNPAIMERIQECTTGVLPNPISKNQLEALLNKTAEGYLDPYSLETQKLRGVHLSADDLRKISVFVASVNPRYYNALKQTFSERPSEDVTTLVSIHTESKEISDATVLNEEQQAMAELWLLSLCDRLLTTPLSAFGYLASALSGHAPHFMNIAKVVWRGKAIEDWQTNGQPPCQIALSAEGCQLFAPISLWCSRDPAGDGSGAPVPKHRKNKPTYQWFPYVKQCQEWKKGLTVL